MSHNPVPAGGPRTLARVAGAALIGSALEWYDYFLYGTAAALVFNKVFFPEQSATTALLLSFATFGVGFVARPVGAAIFGHIGDRLGRKPALVATLLLMGASTTLMAVIPSYGSIGIAAPVMLVVLRLLQGAGSGAEYSGAAIFAVEYAPAHRRGLYGALGASGSYAGMALSSAAVFLSTSLTTDEQFLSWGWRLPFLASVVLVGLGMWLRLRLDETPAFEENQREAAPAEESGVPIFTLLRTQWKNVLLVVGVVAAPLALSYVYQVYALAFLKQSGHSASVGTASLVVAGVTVMVTAPLAGLASDKWGRRPVLIGGAVFAAAYAFPFFWLAGSHNTFLAIVAVAIAQGGSVGIMFGVQGVILAELFATKTRYSGAAVSREIGAVLFGGLAPLISVSLAAAGGGAPWPVGLYVLGLCAITAVAGLFAPETARTTLDSLDDVVEGGHSESKVDA
ncbi:MFS transporter [Amycolatopsis echigonensis]|uniref:Putative proline/betaine transporter n=1 Tax=Amycolatopsis echigonensis TaxID=2576905 RepID=A0A8E2B6J6_9PSEU|nr:MFS transporter [Amycolatopsis echigonensis]MBB2502966.1 MHS family MFS transporter [Amycolatopsis echigonensis]